MVKEGSVQDENPKSDYNTSIKIMKMDAAWFAMIFGIISAVYQLKAAPKDLGLACLTTFIIMYCWIIFRKYRINSEAKVARKKREFNDTIASDRFMAWEIKIFEIIYRNKLLAEHNGNKYPVAVFQATPHYTADSSKEDRFEGLGALTDNRINTNDYEANKIQKEYAQLIENNVKRSNQYGYYLKKLFLNENSEMQGFEAGICTFDHYCPVNS
jgi:hypothetical protein